MVNRDNYTVVRHYMEFCADVRQNSSKTVARRWQYLHHFLEWADEKPFAQAPAIAPTFPRYLTKARIDGRGDRLCYLQQSQILSDIRLFLRWYRTSEHGLTRQIPEAWIETLQPVKQVEPPKERDVFTLEEVRSVLAAPAITLSNA
jgi:hypothetical protein